MFNPSFVIFWHPRLFVFVFTTYNRQITYFWVSQLNKYLLALYFITWLVLGSYFRVFLSLLGTYTWHKVFLSNFVKPLEYSVLTDTNLDLNTVFKAQKPILVAFILIWISLRLVLCALNSTPSAHDPKMYWIRWGDPFQNCRNYVYKYIHIRVYKIVIFFTKVILF